MIKNKLDIYKITDEIKKDILTYNDIIKKTSDKHIKYLQKSFTSKYTNICDCGLELSIIHGHDKEASFSKDFGDPEKCPTIFVICPKCNTPLDFMLDLKSLLEE